MGKLVLLLAVPLLYLLALIVKRLTRKTNPNRTRAEGGLVILKALDTPPDWLINNITEASKNARQIYFIYIIFIMYAVLVIISTSDENIVLNRSAHLPIINVNIPLNGFYILSPIIAIFIFVYFQLYLFKIKYLIDDLRVKYLKVEERRLYPWMLNIADYPEKGVIGIIQTAIGKISIWCLLPIFLSVVTIWYIKRHDPLLPYIFSTGTILITFITICFWYYFDFEVNFSLSGFIKKNYIKIMIFLAIIIPHLLLITKVIPSANKGDDIKYLKNWIMIDLSYQKFSTQPEQDVEESFLIKSKLYCSELQSSENPYSINLEGTHLEGADLTSTNLRQANLGKAHLQKAHMSKAVLERANLEEANLQQAVLFGVNLQKACLKNANLQNAHPWLAILRGADLESVNLQGANLHSSWLHHANLVKAKLQKAQLTETQLPLTNLTLAQLQEANLAYADLQGANLSRANLQRAILWETNLRGANLRRADLRASQFTAVDLEEADLSEADLRGANFGGYSPQEIRQLRKREHDEVQTAEQLWLEGKLPQDNTKPYQPYRLDEMTKLLAFQGSNLRKADLRGADLRGADFSGVNLQGADLRGINLHGTTLEKANLQRADLRHARGVTIKQLSSVYTLHQAIMDSELAEASKRIFPLLWDEPKPEG